MARYPDKLIQYLSLCQVGGILPFGLELERRPARVLPNSFGNPRSVHSWQKNKESDVPTLGHVLFQETFTNVGRATQPGRGGRVPLCASSDELAARVAQAGVFLLTAAPPPPN